MNAFRMRGILGEIPPGRERVGLEGAVVITQDGLGVTFKEERQGASSRADVDRLPETVQHQNVLVEHGTNHKPNELARKLAQAHFECQRFGRKVEGCQVVVTLDTFPNEDGTLPAFFIPLNGSPSEVDGLALRGHALAARAHPPGTVHGRASMRSTHFLERSWRMHFS